MALTALARHPLAVLAALLIVPLGLAAAEGIVALCAWQQGQLPLMVVDLFPPPKVDYEVNGKHLYFDYDGIRINTPVAASIEPVVAVYPVGFRRGFTLSATIPPSLSMGLLGVRCNPFAYEVPPLAYLAMRILATALILSIAGAVLMVQARWLGLITALDARRPPSAPVP
jgi:hypothetical protein